MAYRRSIRRIRRTRRTGRKKRIVNKTNNALVTKSFLKKTLAKAIESKRVTVLRTLENSSETGYTTEQLGTFITPGVTDQGRIGNTIHLTGLQVRYHFQTSVGAEPSTADLRPPITLHMFLVQSKNNWTNPSSTWFKSVSSGIEDPYEPLTNDNIQTGILILNTDMFTVLGHHKRTIQCTEDRKIASHNGIAKFNLKNKKMVFNSNSLSINGVGEIVPAIYLVTYFYHGIKPEFLNTNVQFGVRQAVSLYYKD